jgi:hypothetical protein
MSELPARLGTEIVDSGVDVAPAFGARFARHVMATAFEHARPTPREDLGCDKTRSG